MSSPVTLRLRVWALRARQALGRAGLLGIALLLAASTWLALAWHAKHVPLPEVELLAPPEPAVAERRSPDTLAALDLPHRSEVPLLLTQIQQTVVGHGLGWSAADYKLSPPTDTAPATLEVRCSLKATYPKLRAALAQLLRNMPALGIRDLGVARASIDTAEIDAKLTLVVFLQEDSAPAAEKGTP